MIRTFVSNREKAIELAKLLEPTIRQGRTRLGRPQKNDVEVEIWKKNGRPDILNG